MLVPLGEDPRGQPLLRCTVIILLRCTIVILLCRQRTGPGRLEIAARTPLHMASLAIFDYRRL
jgi:hypothetical protein